MIKMMEMESRKLKANAGPKFTILAENLPMDSAELLQYLPASNLSIGELGKQLLKAATDGNVEEIRILMGKGAPFTADWLGTSPLHLAAQNNHLNACEMLLRAGMSKDARTKVDRTPLHMASYEGHLEIVECLLKNGAEYDCKDMLHMTPLHWAAQNGHSEVAATLIRYGATTNLMNKFDLTPSDIAEQMNRPDITQIITLSIRDPLTATQHLALELISSDNSSESVMNPMVDLSLPSEENEVEEVESEDANEVPIETIMIDGGNNIESINEDVEEVGFDEVEREEEEAEETIQDIIETVETETNSTFSESIKLLQEHGITMLPVDESNILNSVMESGHSVVLTEAGKQALNSIKSSEQNEDITEYLKQKTSTAIAPTKKKKIFTLTHDEFIAMTNNGAITLGQNNILKQINGKLIATPKPAQVKRIVMRKNKIVPICQNTQVKTQKLEVIHDVNTLLEELQKKNALIESYKRKLLKSEVEAARYKQQLKLMMEQSKLAST